MTIQKKAYERASDYERVNDFLWHSYQPGGLYPNWLQPRWEYMHFHPNLDVESLGRIAVWEDDGRVVALVNYEDRPNLAFFHRFPGYDSLLDAMIEHAEVNLSTVRDDTPMTRILVNDFDTALMDVLTKHGYSQHPTSRETVSMMEIPQVFHCNCLPDGFHLADLTEENDLTKLDRCLWRGFNHDGEPEPGGEKDRRLMQSTPNFNPLLNMVAVARSGAYAAYAGIWYDPYNHTAYVEPVATDPDYRRMGLGSACVIECVRRAGELGAKTAFVESDQAFYHSLGFQTVHHRPVWEKILH